MLQMQIAQVHYNVQSLRFQPMDQLIGSVAKKLGQPVSRFKDFF